VRPDLGLPDGWVAVPVRVEWAMSSTTTDWSGDLVIDGGEVLQTPYWSPEIVEADRRRIAWQASTKSFGEPYGSQRGGVEVTLIGPGDATVTVTTAQGAHSTTLGELRTAVVEIPVKNDGRLRLQRGIGGLTSLGAPEHRFSWRDETPESGWYYIRAYQTDGEMAWSSPIWVEQI